MEPQIIPFDESAYHITSRKNKISKQAIVKGTDNIQIEGKAIILQNAQLRGDLAPLLMGEYVIIKEDVIIRPTFGKESMAKKLKYFKLRIGSYVYIDRGTIISASKIGSNVHIGKNCIIGHRCVIKDNCKILDNTILASDTTIPPYTVYGGKPGVFLGELPESFDKYHQEMTISYYKNFR